MLQNFDWFRRSGRSAARRPREKPGQCLPMKRTEDVEKARAPSKAEDAVFGKMRKLSNSGMNEQKGIRS